jgi:uncharacterized membrane protein HdeD (DUF308 family)
MAQASRTWARPRTSGTWLAVRGVIAIGFGVAALIWPGVTILALALLFGAYVLIDGIGMLIDAFRGHRSGGQRAAYAIAGLLGVIAGLVTLVWPGITALVLVILVGAWAVVTGVLGVLAATRIPGSWPLIVLGVLSIVAGVLILFRPRAGAFAIAAVIGIYAIIAGVLMLAELWRSRHARPTTNRAAPAGI